MTEQWRNSLKISKIEKENWKKHTKFYNFTAYGERLTIQNDVHNNFGVLLRTKKKKIKQCIKPTGSYNRMQINLSLRAANNCKNSFRMRTCERALLQIHKWACVCVCVCKNLAQGL